MDNYEQMSLFNDDGEIILPCYEVEANNDDGCLMLENGCMYTLFYNDESWASRVIYELNEKNADFRKCFMPIGMDIKMASLEFYRDTEFGDMLIEQQFTDDFLVNEYYAVDYKNLKEKIMDYYNRIIKNGYMPLSVGIVDVHDVRHLVLLREFAQEYNIPVIAAMSMSKDLNMFINECVNMEVSVVEAIYGGIWARDRIFNKINNAMNNSEAVIIQVDQYPLLLQL